MPDVKDFIPELVCLGIDGIICGALYTAYRGATRIIKDLSEAPEIVVNSSLKEQICNNVIAQTGEDGSVRIPYAVLKGEVAPLGRTVSSAYSPEIVSGVIQKVVFTEHKRNLSRTGFWVDSERILHQYTNDAPFCIINPQESSLSLSRPKVEIIDWSDATKIDLDTVYDKFEQGSNTLSSHLLGWFAGDMHKGTQVTESMLLKGANLTAVGELVYTPMGVRMLPPSDNRPYFLVKNSLSSLMKDYETGKSLLRIFLGIFAGVGFGISMLAVYKYYSKWQQEQLARANEDTLNSIRNDRVNRVERTDIPESLQCVVCLGAEREVILLNCGHVCVCADCGAELLRVSQSCPVCRGTISSLLPAYVS